MRLLLDTHVFLWWLDDPGKLAEPARLAIAAPANVVYVSAVVMQEIAIKRAKGQLRCPEPLLPLLGANHFIALPISLDHAEAMSRLPPIHKDPFDRQLVAQCRVEGLTLVTRDLTLQSYGVPILAA